MTNKETMKSIHSPLIYLENLSNYFQLYPFLCPQPDWHVNILEQHSLLHIFWRISNFSFIYLCKFCNFKMCISLTFCFLSLFPLINNNAKIREAFRFVFFFFCYQVPKLIFHLLLGLNHYRSSLHYLWSFMYS